MLKLQEGARAADRCDGRPFVGGVVMYMFGSGSVPGSSSKLLAAKLLSAVVCVPLPDRVSVAIFELSEIFPKNSYPGFSVSKRDHVVKLYLL